MFTCSDCSAELTDGNWFPSFKKVVKRVCKSCNVIRNRTWREAHPDAVRKHGVDHYWRHRDRLIAAKKVWDAAHKPEIKLRDSRRRRVLRNETLAAYGHTCACCGETRDEFLAIDHTNGDGKEHRKELGSRAMAHLYRWLKKEGFPKDRFRLLCHNCNLARGLYGYCPHQRETTSPSAEPLLFDQQQIPSENG